LTVAHGKTIGEVIDNWNLNKVKHIDADSIVLCKGETIEECKARTKEYWGY
jgi:predicted RNase H-like HicB family nuclease